MNELVPMVNPNDIGTIDFFLYDFLIAIYNIFIYVVLDGWDISKLNLAEAMERAEVLEIGLQDQLRKQLVELKPRPSIYDPDFIAANQVS